MPAQIPLNTAAGEDAHPQLRAARSLLLSFFNWLGPAGQPWLELAREGWA